MKKTNIFQIIGCLVVAFIFTFAFSVKADALTIDVDTATGNAGKLVSSDTSKINFQVFHQITNGNVEAFCIDVDRYHATGQEFAAGEVQDELRDGYAYILANGSSYYNKQVAIYWLRSMVANGSNPTEWTPFTGYDPANPGKTDLTQRFDATTIASINGEVNAQAKEIKSLATKAYKLLTEESTTKKTADKIASSKEVMTVSKSANTQLVSPTVSTPKALSDLKTIIDKIDNKTDLDDLKTTSINVLSALIENEYLNNYSSADKTAITTLISDQNTGMIKYVQDAVKTETVKFYLNQTYKALKGIRTISEAEYYLDTYKISTNNLYGLLNTTSLDTKVNSAYSNYVSVLDKTNSSFKIKTMKKQAVNTGETKLTGIATTNLEGTYPGITYNSVKDNTIQRYVTPKTNSVTETASMGIAFENNAAKITKTDATGQKELEGATLTVRDSNGNIVETWVSSKDPHYIYGLTAGTYTLEEIIAPEGYANASTIKFTVKEDGTVSNVNMKDELTKTQITKEDASNGKEVEGAHLVLKDDQGNIVDEWDSTKKPHVIEGLDGKYTLEETLAPKGYDLNPEVVEFTINKDGSVTKAVMYDEPQGGTPVTVPNTLSNLPLWVYICGGASILIGGTALTLYTRKITLKDLLKRLVK